MTRLYLLAWWSLGAGRTCRFRRYPQISLAQGVITLWTPVQTIVVSQGIMAAPVGAHMPVVRTMGFGREMPETDGDTTFAGIIIRVA